MARSLTCVVGVFRSNLIPPLPLTLGNRSLSSYFEEASRDPSGLPQLDLHFDLSRLADATLPGATTDSVWLQRALFRLTGNSVDPSAEVSKIGLIYADSWRPGVLGMMFDLGFNPIDLPPATDFQRAVPREGCAVFLEEIGKCRPDPMEARTEALYTTVHEIGHVFNLWHKDSPRRFMTRSQQVGIAPATSFAFDQQHRGFLSQVHEPAVWPGGSKFGARGTLAPVGAEWNSLNAPRSDRALELQVQATQPSGWHFEPLELEIQVSSQSPTGRAQTLPDTVDPGYEDFQIWIEEPTGERRRYRSPRHYCQNVGSISVSGTNPYRRDLSIFGQAGSYTFRRPGLHQIFATWRLPDGRALVSNRTSIEIKSLRTPRAGSESLRTTLTRPDVAKLLYHRAGPFRRAVAAALEEIACKRPKTRLSANLNYALGRFYAKAAQGPEKKTRRARSEKAKRAMGEALSSGRLSSRREFHAHRILDELSSR